MPKTITSPSKSIKPAEREDLAKPAPVFGLLLDIKALVAFTGLSRSALYRLIGADLFPKATLIDGAGKRWKRKEVERWAEKLKPARTKSAAQEVEE